MICYSIIIPQTEIKKPKTWRVFMPNALFNKVVKLSGLDNDEAVRELKTILADVGSSPEKVTEEEMRLGLLCYFNKVVNKTDSKTKYSFH